MLSMHRFHSKPSLRKELKINHGSLVHLKLVVELRIHYIGSGLKRRIPPMRLNINNIGILLKNSL